MAETTLEVARRCPKCEEPGVPNGITPAPERYMGSFHMYKCDNSRCKGFGKDWLIQVRPDGTIPPPTLNREKSFPQEKGVARERVEKARARADELQRDSMTRK